MKNIRLLAISLALLGMLRNIMALTTCSNNIQAKNFACTASSFDGNVIYTKAGLSFSCIAISEKTIDNAFYTKSTFDGSDYLYQLDEKNDFTENFILPEIAGEMGIASFNTRETTGPIDISCKKI